MSASVDNVPAMPLHDEYRAEDDHVRSLALMQRVQASEAQAFSELYDSHADLVYSVAMKYLADPVEAEEILQEVFLRLWTASKMYRPELGKVVAWIITMTRNQCLNRLRAQKNRSALHHKPETVEALTPTDTPDAAAVLLRQENVKFIHQALAELPEEQQQPISLSFLHGFTHEEIAIKLNAPLGTIKARIRRGMLKLQDILSPPAVSSSPPDR